MRKYASFQKFSTVYQKYKYKSDNNLVIFFFHLEK